MVISCRPERISLRPICDILSKRRNDPLFIVPEACPYACSPRLPWMRPSLASQQLGKQDRQLRPGLSLHTEAVRRCTCRQRTATAATRVMWRSTLSCTQKSGLSAVGSAASFSVPYLCGFSAQTFSGQPRNTRRYVLVADQAVVKTPLSSTVNWSCSALPL